MLKNISDFSNFYCFPKEYFGELDKSSCEFYISYAPGPNLDPVADINLRCVNF